jgi:hypothetical protein
LHGLLNATPRGLSTVQKSLKFFTDEGWPVCITNCRRYGDNTETKTVGEMLQPAGDEVEPRPAKNSFQYFSQTPRIRNPVRFSFSSGLIWKFVNE